jgi:hypothetical protein
MTLKEFREFTKELDEKTTLTTFNDKDKLVELNYLRFSIIEEFVAFEASKIKGKVIILE